MGKVRRRANSILKKHLHYNEGAVNGFIFALSEVCQNILEHSETTGYVGIQKYHFNNIGKNVVKIAVMDLGIGFKGSLSGRFTFTEDIEAIEQALLHGATRYADEGRGHGLAAVRGLSLNGTVRYPSAQVLQNSHNTGVGMEQGEGDEPCALSGRPDKHNASRGLGFKKP